MKELTTERLTQVDPGVSISDYLIRHATESPDAPLYRRKSGEGWVDISTSEALRMVRAITKGLLASGFQKGDKIAIMARTSFEWTISDLAIWHLGGVPVPIYETSSPTQAQWILKDADVVAVFAESAEHAAVIEEARGQGEGHGVRQVLVFDDGAFEQLIEKGQSLTDEAADAGFQDVGLGDLATIIYTSGTTGRPKGVELTHGNFVELSEEALLKLHQVFAKGGESTLLFIPLAHVFARFVEVLALVKGLPMGHTPDAKQAVQDISTFRPTLLLSVPRVWEKVYNGAELRQGKGMKRTIFRWAAKVSVSYTRACATAAGPSASLKYAHRVADKLVYSKIRALLGGRLEWTISGGAPLGERLGSFYQGIGINMLEGYGLTETAAPTNVNLPFQAKMGTVGPPLPGTSMRIAEDGEILCKGIGIFARYHNNEAATAEAIKDGWFHTGDIGHLDADGYLTITGRKKEIIVTAGGKNVAPSTLEDPLRGHPIISQVVVVGDKQPFVAALVTLDAEVLPVWLATHDRPKMSVAEARKDPTVIQHIQMAVDRANRAVSRAESIREFVILDDDFTIDNDLLTPSMKVKRSKVLEQYAATIHEIYKDVPQPK